MTLSLSIVVLLAQLVPGALADLPGDCAIDRSTWSEESFLGRPRETQDEIRAIAAAIECFALEHQAFPGPTPEVVPIRSLFPDLIPRYRTFIPTDDEWGTDVFYWSDGSHYLVISYAADRAADVDYSSLLKGAWEAARSAACSGATSSADDDRVMVDGQWCQWAELTD